jgi:hypothetical protein
MNTIAAALVGAAMLLLGRKLYWLFVGGAGFVLGTELATWFMQGQPAWVTVLVALVVGIVGALLALFVQRLALAAAGFVAGGYVAASLVSVLGIEAGWLSWLAYLFGGLLGGVLVTALLDWALLVLSSLASAALIVQTIQLGLLPTALLFLVLAALGIAVQARLMWREQGAWSETRGYAVPGERG